MKDSLTKYNSDNLKSSFFRSLFDLPFLSTNTLKTNVKQVGKNYIYEIDVAGINKNDLNVIYEDGYLIVEAKSCREYNSDNYIVQERHVGCTSRSYYVGDIDENKINANYNNGILTIVVEEANEPKNNSKTIKIN